eukprot:4705938-Prymnesium_polylepis.1
MPRSSAARAGQSATSEVELVRRGLEGYVSPPRLPRRRGTFATRSVSSGTRCPKPSAAGAAHDDYLLVLSST